MPSLRIVPADTFDVCAICGAYAELDDLEQAVCYACLPDVAPASLQLLSITGQFHPHSAKGEAVRELTDILTAALEEHNEAAVAAHTYDHYADCCRFTPGHTYKGHTVHEWRELADGQWDLATYLDERIAARQSELSALAPAADTTPVVSVPEALAVPPPHRAHAALAVGRAYRTA